MRVEVLHEGYRCNPNMVVSYSLSLEECGDEALFLGMQYFAFKGNSECRIPESNDVDACITNKEQSGTWTIYEVNCPEPGPE